MKQPLLVPAIEQIDPHRVLLKEMTELNKDSTVSDQPALRLITKLCGALTKEHIAYCHWKSNNALDRSASGVNDLDLLVSRADVSRFTEILYRLGFKAARAPLEKQMVGVLDYFGYDEVAERLVHVHAHYQLVLGHDMTKNFRLPIEQAYLESAVQGDLFRVPAPEFEFIVFVIRMVLKHLTWATMLGDGALRRAERQELQFLLARINRERVNEILKQHLPYIEIELLDGCLIALQPACPLWQRVKAGHELLTSLQANARRPIFADAFMRQWNRVGSAIRRRVRKSPPRYSLESGGVMIAIVGGDGAGKSTAIDALHALFSQDFEAIKVHMGKPAWSWTTIAVRGILKIGQVLGLYPLEASFRETLEQKSFISPGYPWMIREVCRARDRYWSYVKARRFAARGGLVIFDRFPLRQIRLMDGPQTERFISDLGNRPQAGLFLSPHHPNRLARFLIALEESYYRQIALPEILIIIRVEPEIAAKRKPDDDAIMVRERAMEICGINWTKIHAHVIDGSRTKDEVASQLKTLLWSAL